MVVFPLSILQWHRVDTRPSSLDETKHMQLAMDYRDWIVHGVPLTNLWAHVYPPVYHFSIIPTMSVGIPSETKAALANTFYLLVLLIGCVLISRSEGFPDAEGVLAALLTTGYAYVLWISRRALIDFSLMAWVTLSMALLARTKGFLDRRASVCWGAAAGFGLLMKPPFLFFSVGPVLWIYFTSRNPDKRKNLFWGLATCALVCGPWYFWQGAYFIDKASGLITERTGASTDPHTLSGWWYYFHTLRDHMGVGSLIFTLMGIALLMLRQPRAEGNSFLSMWIFSGYVFLSLIVNKDPRHSLPMLPAFALLSIRGWRSILPERWGTFALSAIGFLFMVKNIWSYDHPLKENWQHQAIGTVLAQNHDSTQPFLTASLLAQHARFFARSFKWSMRQQGYALKPISTGDSDACFTEFLIARSGHQDNETAQIEREWQELKPTSRAFQALFSIKARFPLPDGSEATIYGRDPHPQFQIDGLSAKSVQRHLTRVLQKWVQGPLTVSVEATPAQLKTGHLERIHLTCSPCLAQGARVEKVDVVIEKPWLNLYRLWDEDRLGLLALESIHPILEIRTEDVQRRLEEVKGLGPVDVQFSDGKVRLRTSWKGIPLGAVVRVDLKTSAYPRLTATLERISLANIPLPGWLLGKAHKQILYLDPAPSFPAHIDIHQVTLEENRLTLS